MISDTSYSCREEEIVRIVDKPHINFPLWTVGSDERERLNNIKEELEAKLNTLSRLQIKPPESTKKDTAFPGFADFDFILELKPSAPKTKLKTLRDRIKAKLKDCTFLCAEDAILTFFYKDVTFDIFICMPYDRRMERVADDLRHYLGELFGSIYYPDIRAFKYFCKHLNLPIKLFAVECIVLHFIRRKFLNFGLREFLRFLQKGDWSDLPHCAPEELTRRKLQTVATKCLSYLSR